MANIEYVGTVEEILEIDYRGLCVTVLVCDWVKANYRGPTATIKKDKWGFTLANFQSRLQFGSESFAFPLHIEQVTNQFTASLIWYNICLVLYVM